MNNCPECGGELLGLTSEDHLSCSDCYEVFWENADGSLEKDENFDADKFADTAVGDSNWRRE